MTELTYFALGFLIGGMGTYLFEQYVFRRTIRSMARDIPPHLLPEVIAALEKATSRAKV